jgi:hypothetical protein
LEPAIASAKADILLEHFDVHDIGDSFTMENGFIARDQCVINALAAAAQMTPLALHTELRMQAGEFLAEFNRYPKEQRLTFCEAQILEYAHDLMELNHPHNFHLVKFFCCQAFLQSVLVLLMVASDGSVTIDYIVHDGVYEQSPVHYFVIKDRHCQLAIPQTRALRYWCQCHVWLRESGNETTEHAVPGWASMMESTDSRILHQQDLGKCTLCALRGRNCKVRTLDLQSNDRAGIRNFAAKLYNAVPPAVERWINTAANAGDQSSPHISRARACHLANENPSPPTLGGWSRLAWCQDDVTSAEVGAAAAGIAANIVAQLKAMELPEGIENGTAGEGKEREVLETMQTIAHLGDDLVRACGSSTSTLVAIRQAWTQCRGDCPLPARLALIRKKGWLLPAPWITSPASWTKACRHDMML